MSAPRAPRPNEPRAEPLALRGHDGLGIAADRWAPPPGVPERRATVVLAHGGGQTRHAWAATARQLARLGFATVAVDQRGHGDSEWSPAGAYALEDFGADLARVAGVTGPRTVVVGASLGGLAALLSGLGAPLPGAAPAAIAGLALVDIAPRMEPSGVERILGFMRAHPGGFASLDEAADAVAAYLPHRARPRDTRGLERNLRRHADGRLRWHWDPRFLAAERYENPLAAVERLERAAAALTVPTLLIRGASSDVLSEEAARAFLAIVPHARLVDVREATHMVVGDDNDRFGAALVSWLAELEARA